MEKVLAGKIIIGIVNDIMDRKGLGDVWDEIDEDIQDEILGEWEEMIIGILRAGK